MKVALLTLLTLLSVTLTHAQQRVALVIGNSDYVSQNDLKNPVNDARLMKATFEKLGFTVHYHTDVTSDQLLAAVRNYHASLTPGCISAVFFSGHGAQVDDRNYILPTDFKAQFKFELKKSCPSLEDILSVMENAKTGLNLIFLDCCRSVPNLMTKARSENQGLSAYQTESESTLVSYATKHGMVAYDEPHLNNSLYTATLAQELLRPGIVVEEALRRVAKSVYLKSGKKQRPWMYGNLLDPIYLAGKTGALLRPLPITLPPAVIPQGTPQPPRATFNSVGRLVRTRIRNAKSTEASQVYFGTFGEVQAAVSLQWLDDLDGVRGSIFPVSTAKSIENQWQFIGTNYIQGEIDIHVFDGSDFIASGSLHKERSGDTVIWTGITSNNEEVKITRELQRNPAPVVKSNYRGTIGSSQVQVTLNWEKDRRVTGFYKSLVSGKTYQLKGDNTVDGFIYLDEFSADNISGRILLKKTSKEEKLVWSGKIFNPDGRIDPVVIYRE
ncbi:MAG: hypothetical protein ACI9NQ_001245 [Paracoccaceae bacterium]|jgi:hypothetical protein